MRRAARAMLLGLAFVCGCKTTVPSWMSLPPVAERHGVTVVTDGVKRLSFWYLGITGEATNHSGNDYSSCTISYDCLDSLGKKVGTAVASCEDLEDGAVWTFTASFEESDVRDVELVGPPIVRVRTETQAQ